MRVAVDELRVGGIFRATQLDAFVSLVQQGFPVQARAEEDRIVLTARKMSYRKRRARSTLQ